MNRTEVNRDANLRVSREVAANTHAISFGPAWHPPGWVCPPLESEESFQARVLELTARHQDSLTPDLIEFDPAEEFSDRFK